jgi:hypothetical protein
MVTLAMSTERAIGELLHGLLPERLTTWCAI